MRVEQLSHDPHKKQSAQGPRFACATRCSLHRICPDQQVLVLYHTTLLDPYKHSHQFNSISTAKQFLSSASQHAAQPSRSLLRRRFFIFHLHFPSRRNTLPPSPHSVLVADHVSADIAPWTRSATSRSKTAVQRLTHGLQGDF